MTEYDAPPVAASFEEHGSPEQLAGLYGALARAQAKFGPIHRSKTVAIRSDKGNYSFAYAPLEDLHAATRTALTDEGLAVLTPMGTGQQGRSSVRTILAHQDGGRIISTFDFQPLADIKLVGGQVTYLRRYGYSALLNLASDDDADDNDQPMPTQARAAQRRQAPAPTSPRAAEIADEARDPNPSAPWVSAPEGPSPAEAAAKGRAAQALRDHETRTVNRETGEIVTPPPPVDDSGPANEDQRRRYYERIKEANELGIDLTPFAVDESVTRARIIELGTKLTQVITATRNQREQVAANT